MDFLLSSDEENKKMRDSIKISWHQLQYSGSSQTPSQCDLNDYHQFLSLYMAMKQDRTRLYIYETETKREEVKILDTELNIDQYSSITQLPNGDLFFYGSSQSGITLIIDKSYRVRMLPSGIPCWRSSTLYLNNNIYCFGGYDEREIPLSMKFDLKKNRWINLALLPDADFCCHGVVFNGNILISGYQSKNLWLYSIDIDSFSVLPYHFSRFTRKIMINVKKLYLIEWDYDGLIYEGEDKYHWESISKTGKIMQGDQIYCLYNKEKIYISTWSNYYQFDLNKKTVLVIR